MQKPTLTPEKRAALIGTLSEAEKGDLGKLLGSPLGVSSVGRFRRTETNRTVHSIVRKFPSPSNRVETFGPVEAVRAAYTEVLAGKLPAKIIPIVAPGPGAQIAWIAWLCFLTETTDGTCLLIMGGGFLLGAGSLVFFYLLGA